MTTVPIILGTAREGRQSEVAARWLNKQAQTFGFDSSIIDVRDYVQKAQTKAMAEDRAQHWSEIVKKADALIIVSPEYNHGYPGELKLMLDQLYKEYSGKPVALCGVSEGGLGGARVVEMLRLVMAAFGSIQTKACLYFSHVNELFDETGRITDDQYTDRTKKLFDELAQLIG